jgi:acetylornithine deacetylase/succinyl-diaminopimelate desuccinylase-like protein
MTTEREAVAAGFDEWVGTLSEWVAIPSVSADPDRAADVGASADFLAERLRRTGFPDVEVLTSGPYRPAVYAHWPSGEPDPVRVLAYGHHDVQPADGDDRWTHPPFRPQLIGDVLYGRGASDDKGNISAHLLGMAAHLRATGRSAPAVDVTLLVEGEEESGSPHIGDLLAELGDKLTADVIVVSDTGIFDAGTPSLCVGMRGLVAGELHVHGPDVDLHSGVFGGAVPNPISELVRLLAAMHDEHGHIAIPRFYDGVIEPTDSDRQKTRALPFDEHSWITGPAASRAAWGEAGYSTLERIGSRPTAEINGIYGGYTGPGSKTIVPTDGHAKLSFRLVGEQDPAAIRRAVTDFFAFGVRAGLTVDLTWQGDGVRPLYTDPNHPAAIAAQRALGAAFDTATVLLTREGGSGPEAELVDAIGAPMVFLGVMTEDDQIHAPNERAPLPLLRKGCEAIAHLWRELAELGRDGLVKSDG